MNIVKNCEFALNKQELEHNYVTRRYARNASHFKPGNARYLQHKHKPVWVSYARGNDSDVITLMEGSIDSWTQMMPGSTFFTAH